MAGEWIKVEITLPNKPEVIRIGRTLGLSPDAVCGVLIRFWGWASANSVDGFVTQLALQDVDMLVTLPGFADAMVAVGWLRHEAELDRICIPNFTRHNGESSKKRALTAKRQERYRNANSNATVTRVALPEKRREEKSKPKAKATTPIPAFVLPDWIPVDAWQGWIEVRTKMRAPNTPRALTLAAKTLDELRAAGHDPVKVLELATTRGWRGLFAPKSEFKGGNGKGDDWWTTEFGTNERGRELGVQARPGESMDAYRDRLRSQR